MPLCSPLAPVRVPRVYPACVEQKGRLSGFVPFVQVSDNAHKRDVEAAVADARTHIYFRDAQSAERALSALTALRAELLSAADANDANTNADTNADTNDADAPPPPQGGMAELEIRLLSAYEPSVYGLDVPEPLMMEAFITRPDLSPMIGWETVRAGGGLDLS